MNGTAKKITMLAALCALSYVVMLVGRIPITTVEFLKYDPKDVIIIIGGFMFGPMSTLIVSTIVSLVEMLTVSGTGPIGFLMNVLSTVAFAFPAAWIYKRYKTITAAIIGLIVGILLMTVMMIAWNYFITPLYMGVPREAVVKMLIPLFLPFNLIKGGLNGVLCMLLYKPAVSALRRARLIPPASGLKKSGHSVWIIVGSLVVLALLVVLSLALAGVI